MKALGITRRGHSGRHWFASRIAAETGDIYATSKLLGHAHVQSSEHYAEFIPTTAAQAVGNLDPAA
jgi:integrase